MTGVESAAIPMTGETGVTHGIGITARTAVGGTMQGGMTVVTIEATMTVGVMMIKMIDLEVFEGSELLHLNNF